MAFPNNRRGLALTLAALAFLLAACTPQDDPSASIETPSPAAQTSPPQDSGNPPEETSSVPSSPSGSPSPNPQSPSPTPSAQSEPPSDSPSPPANAPQPSGSPSPSASVPQPSDFPSPSAGAPQPSQPGPVPEGASVENEWFSDSVFVGDSRTDGLRLYSGVRGASFICHTGLSVFTVGKSKCINSDGQKVTAMEALAKEHWAKVYLMLGVNELGYSTAAFKTAYTQVVDEIRLLQPDAAIYLQTLIPVNEAIAYQNGTNRAINNAKLKEFNLVIAEVAQEKGAFLVDVDTPFWSPQDCLAAENTGDGVHLTRAGYVAWLDYLKTHTGTTAPIVFEPPMEALAPGEPSAEISDIPAPVPT